MTYVREVASTEAIITEILRQIAPAEIEAATGVKVDTLQRAANPYHRGRLGYEVAGALDALCHAKGLGRPLTERWRVISSAGDAVDSAGLDRELRQATASLGELAGTFDAAVEDGVIEQHEADRILEASTEHLHAARRVHDRAAALRARPALHAVGQEPTR